MTETDAEFIHLGRTIAEMATRLRSNGPGCDTNELKLKIASLLGITAKGSSNAKYIADELLAEIKKLEKTRNVSDIRHSILSTANRLNMALDMLEYPPSWR